MSFRFENIMSKVFENKHKEMNTISKSKAVTAEGKNERRLTMCNETVGYISIP